MRNYLPSRTFVGIAVPLATGFCAALALLYVAYDASSAATPDRGELVALARQAILDEQFAERDTDGDGLQDWEEGIWKTDRRNPDTDGDGTPDNEEILADRDPLVPGPNDMLAETAATTTASSTPVAGDLTQELSRNFFGPYLELKQTGQFNEFNKERLLRNVTQNTAQT
ncbi:hypothetical protein GVX82_04380, partial [Patescibacteria group bacterium]|nr:hypothetical protein [Patescibacteria group bacterium]